MKETKTKLVGYLKEVKEDGTRIFDREIKLEKGKEYALIGSVLYEIIEDKVDSKKPIGDVCPICGRREVVVDDYDKKDDNIVRVDSQCYICKSYFREYFIHQKSEYLP